MTTLSSMLQEMQTWVTVSEDTIKKADSLGINTNNSKVFKRLVNDWINGMYDEDPELLTNKLIYLIK